MLNYRLPNHTALFLHEGRVRSERQKDLEDLIRVANFHGWTDWRWEEEWAECQPEWKAVWEEFGHFAGPGDYLATISPTFANLRVGGDLEQEWGETDRFPLDLGHLTIAEEGTVARDWNGGCAYPNQSDLLAYVLSDFLHPGAIIAVWASDETWAYEIIGPGEIRGLHLVWVTRENEVVYPLS